MQVPLILKIDPRMKSALQRLAKKNFISVSSVVKQAIERHLQDYFMDWRKDSIDKISKK